eukprot:c20263_g1_i2.p1 GENE.c20263_g1_i2~~c20263_g1_i2.p1  ORF type:complete len:367 (+),score=126.51 c20263_g1_i2:24-1124(+)
MECQFDFLPDEVLPLIFMNVDPYEALILPSVCKRWKNIFCGECEEKYWKNLCKSKHGLIDSCSLVADEVMNQGTNDKSKFWKVFFLLLKRTENRLPSTFQPHPNNEVILKEGRVLQFAPESQTNPMDGDNRAVRTNIPFPQIIDLSTQEYLQPYFFPQLQDSITNNRSKPTYICAALSCFYYEITVIPDSGEINHFDCLSVGLANESFPLNRRQPGWTPGSFGYHSDDGHRFIGRGYGDEYGPSFGQGDTIGCGICLARPNGLERRIFFTKNGEFLGHICEISETFTQPLYPCLGVSLRSAVTWNLGEEPFKYNLLSRDWEDPLMTENRGSLLKDVNWLVSTNKIDQQSTNPIVSLTARARRFFGV